MVTAWNEIKAEYLRGVTPKELAAKYNLTPKQISDKANKDHWVDEKAKISENMREDVQEDIKRGTKLAVSTLIDIASDVETEKSVKVQACKALLDISGLKTSKQEIDINKDPFEVKFV